MNLFPVDYFEADIPRPPADVLKALSDLVHGSGLSDPLQYQGLLGTVTGNSFVVRELAGNSRGPHYYYCGEIVPNGSRSRAKVTLKPRNVGWMLLVYALGFCVVPVCFGVMRDLSQVKIWTVAVLAVFVGLFIYLSYTIALWSAKSRKGNLIRIMTYYGTRPQLQSID